MSTIVFQIILCLIAATILGFIIGWIFSSFIKSEKHENQINTIKERFDENKEEINKIKSDFEAKERELSIVKKEHTTMQKEILTTSMDYEENSNAIGKLADLEYDNKILTGQIKEQKICEDENEKLRVELDSVEEENITLIGKLEELKEFESGYKNNIHRIAELESQQKRDNNEEIIKLELKELESEKQSLLDNLEKHRNKIVELKTNSQNSDTDKKNLLNQLADLEAETNKNISELSTENINLRSEINELELNSQNLDEDVCKNKEIIKKSDLSLIGLENDKVTKVIKNLFK